MTLLTECHASMGKIPDVIRSVLRSLTEKIPESLPSNAFLSWMMAEANNDALKHVGTEMFIDLRILSCQGKFL
jgi:hypothetical protein